MNSSSVVGDKTMPGYPESTIDSLLASNELLTSLLESLRELVGVEVTVPIEIEFVVEYRPQLWVFESIISNKLSRWRR